MRLGPISTLRPHARVLAAGIVCLLITNALAQAIPWVVKLTIDAVSRHATGEHVFRLSAAIVGLACAQGVIRVASRILLFHVGRQTEYELRNQLFGHLLTLQPSFYRRHSTGELMSRLTNDLAAVRAMYGPGILYIANSVFAYALAIPLMIQLHAGLTGLALLPYPLLFWAAKRVASRIHLSSAAVQQELGTMGATLQEDLAGVSVVKAYTLEARRARAFSQSCESYLERSMELTRARALMQPLMAAAGGLGTLLVLVGGGWAVVHERITLGDFVAFNIYLTMLTWPTLAVGWIVSIWQRGLASWDRLRELLIEQPTISDHKAHALGEASMRGDIEVRNLSVQMGDRLILDHVNLRVPHGSVVGLVGRVGSGKSTLLEAIVRLIEIPAGSIWIGGRDVTQVPLSDLRRSIGYAPQDSFLFSTSIEKNIEMGGGDADRASQMAEVAGLGSDLKAFPHGLKTIVGERGITLSGGQRQRTALARALAGTAPVLILDDALSSVDTETERQILLRLRQEMRGRTAIVVSHRVTALCDVDRVFVLDAGRVAESGTHQELLEKGGIYFDLYSRQIAEQELEAM